ncbi:carbohydrate-binding protein [Thermoclostridium stercorarium]|uniref:carbohydrate-binding protein n=1 Tax=Thermoclostridium stercorarium TaxID=1510 RepID=UPI0022494949|nr:carbohydrate-binding protein [Thermoclostridium stercorarium]UZQ86194.1 carbohydrate-binding protein [Thermoclostridium stercorarium]
MSIFDDVLFETDSKKKGKNKQNSGKTENKIKEFKEEFSENISEYDYQPYRNNGVILTRLSDHSASVKYDGLLAKCGAEDVYTVVGYGSNSNWENVQTIRMNRVGNTFQADIPAIPGKNINIAFKDGANNWDNNSGMNYTFVQ